MWKESKARDERENDLMTNVFKKYHSVLDTEFVRYIKINKELHNSLLLQR